jgi:twitching motility protein PilT
MIEKILDQSVQKLGHEISFVLGNRVLAKTADDWFELKGDSLTVSEWEDLKDLCLQSNEKIQLETKGYVDGVYESEKHHWKFSFTEKKECFKAYLSLILPMEQMTSGVENPYFWDMVKKDKGLFVVAGEKRQGKSTLVGEIILNDNKDRLRLTGLHVQLSQQKWPTLDSVTHLGADSVGFPVQHSIYDGIERIVVDFNTVADWSKWISFVEQGQSVLLTVSVDSATSLLQKLSSELPTGLFERWVQALNGVITQKFVGAQKVTAHEIFILRQQEKTKLLNEFSEKKSFYKIQLEEFGAESYQSLNQSLIQRLIRRKVDVKSAFAASNDPDQLDAQLKKLGL